MLPGDQNSWFCSLAHHFFEIFLLHCVGMSVLVHFHPVWWGGTTIFLCKIIQAPWSFILNYNNHRSQICHDKTTFRSKTDPTNKFLNIGNGVIVFSSSSSTHRHTSTRSCYNIYSRLWRLSVPTFLIFEDFRGFWLGTCDIYPRCPAKNICDFLM